MIWRFFCVGFFVCYNEFFIILLIRGISALIANFCARILNFIFLLQYYKKSVKIIKYANFINLKKEFSR